MDIDISETTTSWLKLDPKNRDEPPRKRTFFGNFRNEDGTNVNKEEEIEPKKNLGYGTGAPFIFTTPKSMEKIRDIEPDSIENEFTKSSTRGLDSRPISLNVAKKASKERSLVLSKLYSGSHKKTHGTSKSKTINLDEINKLQITPNRANHKPISLDSTDESSESCTSEDDLFKDTGLYKKTYPGSAKYNHKSSSKTSSHKTYRNKLKLDSAFESTIRNLQVHRDIPSVVSGYIQLMFNIFMAGVVLVVVIQVVRIVNSDIERKIMEYSAEIAHEIATCSKKYLENKCDPLTRVPAMETECRNWEACMNRDPILVGRGKITAETLAEIAFFLLFYFGSLYINNTVLSSYRKNKHDQNQNQNIPFPAERTGHFLMNSLDNSTNISSSPNFGKDGLGSFTAPQRSRLFSDFTNTPLSSRGTPTANRDRDRFKSLD
ncbi:Nucleus export protein BRR6 [Smittium culicis]|uniref:Nucleus export protein BRR6 n=1 Tax=Smittium culicis TaxID=133412 RepID=A0A1R1XR40_9FUNG|nr:Nucleus export protein BRR6 [Smittium culicis]OMJ25499.1 Nucleus export protein BRR6 [Smittium culicis]